MDQPAWIRLPGKEEAPSRRGTVTRLIGAVALGPLVLSTLSLLPRAAGFDFLPSTEWIGSVGHYGHAAGLGFAVVWLVSIIVASKTIRSGPVMRLTVTLFAPLMGYATAYSATVIAPPMIMATVAGHEIELPYTVASGVDRGSRRCRSSIRLEGLPILSSRVCGAPAEVDLKGVDILIRGRGTAYGVWAESYRRAD